MIEYMFLYFQHREGSSAAAVYKCMVSFAHSSTQSSPLVVGSLSKQTALLLHQERAELKACGFCGRLSYGHNPGQLPVKRHIHLYPAPVPTVRVTDHNPHQSVCQLETQQDRILHGWDPPIHPVSVFYAQIKKKKKKREQERQKWRQSFVITAECEGPSHIITPWNQPRSSEPPPSDSSVSWTLRS